MRVALIAPPFESVPPKLYGGTERVVEQLCIGLKEAGVDVTVFASGDSQIDAPLIPTTPEAFRLRKQPIHDANSLHLRMLALVAQHAHEFDILHNHHDYWMLPLTEMGPTPVLTTLHGRLDLPDLPASYLSYPKGRFVSISDSQRGPLSLLPWVKTIYHGIDLEQYEYRSQPGKYLAFLGRISWEKRPDLAIQMAHESGVPLKIAAKIEGKENEEYFKKYVQPHIDGNFIEFLGEISESEKGDFLGNALALVFPIDWPEPFGLVVVEALACGTPVLARPFGSMTEILQDGVVGYVHSDVQVLARKIPNLDKISRQDCRRWVETRFSRKRMTEDYLDVYRELTNTSRKASTEEYSFWRAPHHRRNFLHSL